jgi:hypothetical protein
LQGFFELLIAVTQSNFLDIVNEHATSAVPRDLRPFTMAKILNRAEPEETAPYNHHSNDQEKCHALKAWGGRLKEIVRGTRRPVKVVPLRRG